MDQCTTLSRRAGYKRYIESLILSLKTCRPISSCKAEQENAEVCRFEVFIENVTNFAKQAQETSTDSESKRDSWGNGWEFLMSCIALSVGLGNVWRFPFTALDNGGRYLMCYITQLVKYKLILQVVLLSYPT